MNCWRSLVLALSVIVVVILMSLKNLLTELLLAFVDVSVEFVTIFAD